MANYLLEIGLEEMPAHLVSAASAQLETRMAAFLKENRVSFDSIAKFSTPRRLAVLVSGLSDTSESIDEAVKRPFSAKIAKKIMKAIAQSYPRIFSWTRSHTR